MGGGRQGGRGVGGQVGRLGQVVGARVGGGEAVGGVVEQVGAALARGQGAGALLVHGPAQHAAGAVDAGGVEGAAAQGEVLQTAALFGGGGGEGGAVAIGVHEGRGRGDDGGGCRARGRQWGQDDSRAAHVRSWLAGTGGMGGASRAAWSLAVEDSCESEAWRNRSMEKRRGWEGRGGEGAASSESGGASSRPGGPSSEAGRP